MTIFKLAQHEGLVNRASTPGNGIEGMGGMPGATIPGVLIGAGENLFTFSGIGGSFGDTGAAPGYLEYPHFEGQPPTPTPEILVGYGKLKNLLRPRHSYFSDKQGGIRSLAEYWDKDKECRLLFPKVSVQHRENPYRKHQLTQKSTGRTAKQMLALMADRHLANFKVVDMTLTMPKEVSEHLAGRGKLGRAAAWRMNELFWADMASAGLIPEGYCRSANLHTWKTECPVEPHFHFHELVPNYVGMPAPGEFEGEVDWTFKKWGWHRDRAGTVLPFPDEKLDRVKVIWTTIVKRYCRQHNLHPAIFDADVVLKDLDEKKATLNVHVTFLQLDTMDGRTKFMHKLNYKARHWSEDFAYYSNKHEACPDPPEWLMHYDNRTRVFGWWGYLGKLTAGLPELDDKDKLSPYTAEPLEYRGRCFITTALERSQYHIVGVDFVRGRPIERLLGLEDIAWLLDVEDRTTGRCLAVGNAPTSKGNLDFMKSADLTWDYVKPIERCNKA